MSLDVRLKSDMLIVAFVIPSPLVLNMLKKNFMIDIFHLGLI